MAYGIVNTGRNNAKTCDAFEREDNEPFAEDCKGALAPIAIGQLMLGPDGRLFVSIGEHEIDGNQYGKWLPIIDDNGKSAAAEVTTFSAQKIGQIANGLAQSISNMGQALTSAISSLGTVVGTKMGYVRALATADSPNAVLEAGIYLIEGIYAGWEPVPESIPVNTPGVLEVFPSHPNVGAVLQRFTTYEGDLYHRVRASGDYQWSEWKKVNAD